MVRGDEAFPVDERVDGPPKRHDFAASDTDICIGSTHELSETLTKFVCSSLHLCQVARRKRSQNRTLRQHVNMDTLRKFYVTTCRKGNPFIINSANPNMTLSERVRSYSSSPKLVH